MSVSADGTGELLLHLHYRADLCRIDAPGLRHVHRDVVAQDDRPEHVVYAIPKGEKAEDYIKFKGVTEVSEMLGDIQNVYVDCGTSKAVLKSTPEEKYPIGEEVVYYVRKNNLRFFDAETENVIPFIKK